MRRDDIKRLVESLGVQEFTNRTVRRISEGHIKPERVSIRALWEALVGPVEDTLSYAHQVENKINFLGMAGEGRRKAEETGSSAFPIITGSLLAAKVMEGYDDPQFIGDSLVEPMTSRLKTETIPGFGTVDGPLEVTEGMPYEDSKKPEEKYVTSTAKKRGRIISLTEEMILFDQTGQLLNRAMRVGQRARRDREERILNGITGVDTNVYKPAGSATTLYSTGHKNLKVSNALVNYTNVDAFLQLFAAQTDEAGKRIGLMPKDVIVPFALAMRMRQIATAKQVRFRTPQAAGTEEQETDSDNPVAGMFNIMTSSILDGLSTTDWFMGDFKRAFVYHTIWPLQTLAAKPGHEEEFDRDVVFKYKVREFGNVACVDHRFVAKSQSGA